VVTGENIKPPDSMQVKIGAHYLHSFDDGRFVTIDSLKMHEKYHLENNMPVYDIGIMRTKHPMPLGGRPFQHGAIAAIDLPFKWPGGLDQDYIEGDLVIAAGWGPTNMSLVQTPIERPVPGKAIVPMLPLSSCKFHSPSEMDISICVGSNKGTCLGNAGWPLFRPRGGSFEIIGLSSHGSNCALKDHHDIYVRITKFLDWINDFKNNRTTTV
jgi:hypothetical protein